MIIPFINFTGQACEAISLYETVFSVQDKQISFYKEMPAEVKSHFPTETENYVLHAEMIINGTKVWIGDTTQRITPGDIVSLAVPFSSEKEVQQAFGKLKVGGTVLMELTPTFYSPLFGVVKDKYGVIWHLICQ